MNRDINNTQDVLDSRDVIARFEELETELQDAWESERENRSGTFDEWVKDADENEEHTLQDAAHEFIVLRALIEEAEGYAEDWKHGATLIRETYFVEDYARELANDCYGMKKAEGWPFCHIDWEAAAEALQQDYTSVEFDGVTYWVR